MVLLYNEERYTAETERKGRMDVIIVRHGYGSEGALHVENCCTQLSNLQVLR